jgi:exodeoxyribonuclease III
VQVQARLNALSARRPVVYLGDLNVAHEDVDFYNPAAPHIKKQSGLTPEERASHGAFLATDFSDAFRFYYPAAFGQYSFWSQKNGNRPDNKGLRLDYFLCSNRMFPPKPAAAQKKEAEAVAEAGAEGGEEMEVETEAQGGRCSTFL